MARRPQSAVTHDESNGWPVVESGWWEDCGSLPCSSSPPATVFPTGRGGTAGGAGGIFSETPTPIRNHTFLQDTPPTCVVRTYFMDGPYVKHI